MAQRSVASVVLVPALKVPGAQSAHWRSWLMEAATVVRVPGPHGVCTGTHAAPSFLSEYVWPATQKPHWRSAVTEPAAATPFPTGHVAHVAHASLPAVALNVPGGQEAQTRSELVVEALLMNVPAEHGALTGVHAAPPSALEKCVTPLQTLHWRSAVAEPAAVMPAPTGHFAHTVQDGRPALLLNVPAAHEAHVRSAAAVASVCVC